MKKAAVRRVEHTEAIFARFDFEIREELAVNQNGVAKNFGHPSRFRIARHGIVQLSLEIEKPVVNHERNFVFAARKIQPVLEVVAHKKCAEESGENIQPVNAKGVIVIPEHGRVLLVGIVAYRRLSWHVPILWIPVAVRRGLRAMKMDDRAHFGLVGFGAMNAAVDREEMGGWEFIDPLHQQTLTAARFESRAGRTGSISPQMSWLQIAVDFRFELPHGDAVEGKLHSGIVRAGAMAARLNYFWHRQWVDEGRERPGIEWGALLDRIGGRLGLRHTLAHSEGHGGHSALR